jgi:hypothetical protein
MPRTTFLQKPLPCVHGYATKDCHECGPAAEHGARVSYVAGPHCGCLIAGDRCKRPRGHTGGCSPIYELTLPPRAAPPTRRHR